MAMWKLRYPTVVTSLWNGVLVQSIDEHNDIQCKLAVVAPLLLLTPH